MRAVLGCLVACAGVPALRAQSLYNAGWGSLPEVQGWTFAALGSDTETLQGGAAVLNTTATDATQAGWEVTGAADLNHTNGFALTFTVQVNSESHVSTNRAGFSVIVLCDDKQGIELAFWTNSIFAQSDNPLFTQAESVPFVTSTNAVAYTLSLLATNYVLQANGGNILSGPLRNYSADTAPLNPYSTPNFIFFGDDTTSAASSFAWYNATLLFPVKLALAPTGLLSWTGVSNHTYRVQASTNLINWSAAGTAASANNSFQFTGAHGSPRQFYRVAFP